MSEGPRFPRQFAELAANRLCEILGATFHGGEIVGSVRRRRPHVGDLEFIAPMPASAVPPAVLDKPAAPTYEDALYYKLAEHFYDDERTLAAQPRQQVLFGAAPPPSVDRGPRLGTAIKGLKPRFRACSLSINLAKPYAGMSTLNVQIYRYDAGVAGNRGWIQLIRTGPGDFSEACVTRWQQIRHREWSRPLREQGSVNGYPLDQEGKSIPVPTEAVAFALLRMTEIDPAVREVGRVRNYYGRQV